MTITTYRNESFGCDPSERASVLVGALLVLTITLTLVGLALSTAVNRYRTSHHSVKWAQAQHAAEAGVEITLATANKNSWISDGWSAAPGDPGEAAVTKSITLATAVSTTGVVIADVSVDTLLLNGRNWLRIRSTGIAEMSGGAVADMDSRDVMLRKVSLLSDRNTGAALTTPRSTRSIEILAFPSADTPFQRMFVSKELNDIHGLTVVDSFDSRDSLKSSSFSDHGFASYGIYPTDAESSKRQANGDIATLDGSHVWNLNDAYIYGDVYTPNPAATNVDPGHDDNVQGTFYPDFTFEFPEQAAPTEFYVVQSSLSNSNRTLTAGSTEDSPTRYKIPSINLAESNKSLRISNPAGASESWVEVWVPGDVIVDAKSQCGIRIDPGVHVTFHFGSKVEVKGGSGGYAIQNGNNLASTVLINAYGGSSGSHPDFILTNATFYGVVMAQHYKTKLDKSNFIGALLVWQLDGSDYAKLHFDEALRDFQYGEESSHTVASWVEAVR